MPKTRRSPKLRYEFLFHPLGVVDGFEYDLLSSFLNEQNVVPAFKLRALRRREKWAIELPPGAFTGRLGNGETSVSEDADARERILRLIKEKTGAYNLDRTRDIITKNGVTYYRKRALEQFRIYIRPNSLFVAAYAFLQKAEEDPTLIRGDKPIQGTPLKDRPIVNSRRARGPAWSTQDDYVLRKWFGKWHDGKHHKLTETQWNTVLEELKGFRSKESVKRRLSELNTARKRSLMVDGYIHRDAVKAYLDGFLGERAVVPRFRPRLNGEYHPKRRNLAPSKPKASEPRIVTHLDALTAMRH